jgi:hypothetical protein
LQYNIIRGEGRTADYLFIRARYNSNFKAFLYKLLLAIY